METCPKTIVKKFDVEFAAPATILFNSITQNHSYPEQWKIENGTPIPKETPETEDDLRFISKTAFLSKVSESFLVEWLMVFISPYIDPGQCGGLKGLSVNTYLIKLLHFAFSVLDRTTTCCPWNSCQFLKSF